MSELPRPEDSPSIRRSRRKDPLRILYLEDDPSDVDLVRFELEKIGFDFTLKQVDTRETYIRTLREFMPELVLSDHGLPSFDSQAALSILKKECPEVPFIIVSGALGEERAIEILKTGVTDYVLKGRLSRLSPAVRRALQEASERADRKRAEEALRESEERYMLAVQGARDGLWDWDLRRGELYTSPRWKEMLGYQENEIGAGPEEWIGRVHPSEAAPLQAQIQAHLEGRTPHFEFEHRLRRRDGSYQWVLARGVAVRMAEDKPHRRIAGSLTDISERKRVEAELVRNAFFDRLTNLPNRALFENRLERAIGIAARRKGYMFALLFLDIDRFKVVNDGLGHSAGDQLLAMFARRLESCLRPSDTIARFGGDEFGILLEDVQDGHDAAEIAERIRVSLSDPFPVDGQELLVTASIGVVLNSSEYETPGAYLRNADAAMYWAKSLGRARCEIFDDKAHTKSFNLGLEKDLRKALERSELVIHYQPFVSLGSRRITGCEALVRWKHPTQGLLFPGDFIPLAEETGLIIPIGEWVLRTASTRLQKWLQAGPPDLNLAVNLSARQFNHADLAGVVVKTLQESALDPARLKLELTESMVMGYSEQALRTIQKLKSLKVDFSIDDFGTGYSSLTYLRRFPCESLKIDRSFVRDVTTDPDAAAIATAIISLAHSLRMRVIAEGIETKEQLQFLDREQCDEGQGYLFCRPLPADEFLEFVKS